MHPSCCQLWRIFFEDVKLTIKAFVFEDLANLPACKLGRLHEILIADVLSLSSLLMQSLLLADEA